MKMIDKELLEKSFKSLVNKEPCSDIHMDSLVHDAIFRFNPVGSLITVSARPAMGKTAYIMDLMYRLLSQGKKCMFLSCKYNDVTIIRNLLMCISGVDAFKCCRGTDKDLEKLKLTKDELSNFDVTIHSDIFDVEHIRTLIDKEKPEFVFVDEIDLIYDFNKKSDSKYVSDVFVELKRVAKECNCIIFDTCTTPKVVDSRKNKRPVLSDLREVGGVDIVSDAVIFIYRDSYYTCSYENMNELPYYEAEIFLAKNNLTYNVMTETIYYKKGKYYLSSNDFVIEKQGICIEDFEDI